MGWFKRLCLFVFGNAGLLSLVVLSLTWVGPWTPKFRSWLELEWFFMTLEVLVCIAALGCLACVLAALFSPRNPRETIVAQVSGGQITVTRSAIVSQTKHIIEADGTCIASSIKVKVRKRGNVRVFARVKPRYPVDVVAQGEKLYAELQEGLAHVCGDSVKSISVVFTEPAQIGEQFVSVEETPQEPAHQASSAESITVPMSQVVAPEPEPVPELAPEPMTETDFVPDQALETEVMPGLEPTSELSFESDSSGEEV